MMSRLLSLIAVFSLVVIHGLGVFGEEAERDAVAPGWVMTRSFPAREAHQAAAADDRHFYVINNTHVVAYDRRSGERRWVSHGDSPTHLNSGFVLDGRIYCAHSNYPREPNTGQIKVVDLRDGSMSDFKDFGVTEGSLTWAVRRDDGWWCNFAYYGERNHETRLVRFDDDWQETGSWTFPEKLIAHLGRHSVSGGIWHGDTLLVTDHDDPVIYRLRLPEANDTQGDSAGGELQWVDRLAAPITGQGFAVDPAGRSGDLPAIVGINRAERLVITAQPDAAIQADSGD